MGKEYLTKEKYKELKEEFENLITVKRKEIAKELDFAVSLGDLKENAEYHQAREAQGELESRIIQLESILKNSEIIDNKNKDIVNIGSIVTICKSGQKDCIEYKIVGEEEANMLEKKMSFQSPLAKAMMNKRKGEVFSFDAPAGVMEYKIISIK